MFEIVPYRFFIFDPIWTKLGHFVLLPKLNETHYG